MDRQSKRSDVSLKHDQLQIDWPVLPTPYSPEFRHQAVLLTRSRNVPVTHAAHDLGISIDTLRD